jgi:hypothetical protein
MSFICCIRLLSRQLCVSTQFRMPPLQWVLGLFPVGKVAGTWHDVALNTRPL